MKHKHDPIILTVHTSRAAECGNVIRISPEAQRAIAELVAETGLSVRHVASTLIVEAAKRVEIMEV